MPPTSDGPDDLTFGEELRFGERGFDSIWTVEHHFTPYKKKYEYAGLARSSIANYEFGGVDFRASIRYDCYADVGLDITEKSMRLFAKEVLPAVHEMQVLEPFVATEPIDCAQTVTANRS